MLDRNRLTLVLMVVFATSCDGPQQQAPAQSATVKPTPPPRASAKQAATPQTPKNRIDKVSESPKFERFDFATAKFKAPELRETVERWEATAAEFYSAKASTVEKQPSELPAIHRHHEPWYFQLPIRSGGKRPILQRWTTSPTRVISGGSIDPIDVDVTDEVSRCILSFGLNNKTNEVTQAQVQSYWVPANGWGAEFRYETRENFFGELNFGFINHTADATSHFRDSFLQKISSWHHHVSYKESHPSSFRGVTGGEFDLLIFELSVSFPLGARSPGSETSALALQRLLEMRKSPAEFKRVSMTMLDDLARKIEDEFASGEVVRQAYHPVTGANIKSGEPPEVLSLPAYRSLTEAEQKEFLELARSYVAGKREWIEKNHVQLHTALVNVFPLDALE